MDSAALTQKVDVAQQRLERAESQLEKALATLEKLPRSEKTLVSDVLREAFDSLKDARRDLTEIEDLLRSGDGS